MMKEAGIDIKMLLADLQQDWLNLRRIIFDLDFSVVQQLLLFHVDEALRLEEACDLELMEHHLLMVEQLGLSSGVLPAPAMKIVEGMDERFTYLLRHRPPHG